MAWKRLDSRDKIARRSCRRGPRIRQHLNVNAPVHAVVSQLLRDNDLGGDVAGGDHAGREMHVDVAPANNVK